MITSEPAKEQKLQVFSELLSVKDEIERLKESLRKAEDRERGLKVQVSEFIEDSCTKIAALTTREQQIVVLLWRGKQCKEIAAELSISLSTVKFHISSVLSKSKVDSSAQLLRQLNKSHFDFESLEKRFLPPQG